MVFGGRSSVDSLYKQDIWEWSGTDATLTNRTTGGTKPDAAQPGGHGLRQQARPAAAVRRLRGTAAPTTTSGPGRRPPASGRRSPSPARGRRARYGVWMFYDAARDKVYVYGHEPGRLPDLGVRPGAEQVAGSHGHLAADGRVAQLLRRRVRHRPRQDRDAGRQRSRGGYNTDIWEWDTTTGVWAQADAGGRHRRSPTGATTTRSRTTRSGGSCCWWADTSRSPASNAAVNDSWEWDANLRDVDRDDAGRGQAAAARAAPDGVQLDARARPTCSAAPSPATPTYGPSEFWEYLPERGGRGRTARAARRRRPTSCMSKNCVDGVCCAQTAAAVRRHLQVVQRRGHGRDVQQRPGGTARRHLPERPGLRRRPSSARSGSVAGLHIVHRVRERQLRRRRLLRHRLQRHAASSATWPAKRGTCSFVADGRRGPVGRRPACPTPIRGGSATAPAPAATPPSANGKPCTAGGSARAATASTASAATAPARDLLPVRQAAARRDAARSIAGRPAGSQRDHAVRRPDAVLQRLRHLRDQQEAERRPCAGGDRVRHRTSASTGSAATAPAPAPASRARWRARWAPASTCRPARRTRTRRTPCTGAAVLRRRRHLPVGPEAERRDVRRGGRVRLELLRRRRLLRRRVHRRLLHLQPAGQRNVHGQCVAGATDTIATTACAAPNYCDAACTTARPARSRTARCAPATSSAGRTSASTAPAARARASGNVQDLQERDGHLHVRGRRDGPARWTARGEGVCTGTCNGQGACRWGPQGTVCAQAGLPGDDRHHHAARARATAPATARDADAQDCNGFGCYTDTQRRRAVQDGLLDRSRLRARALLRDHGRRRHRRRRRDLDVPGRSSRSARLHAQHAVPDRNCASRWAAATASAATSNCDKCGTCNTPRQHRHLHPDPGRHRSRRRVHGQRQRSDAASAAASATARRAARTRRRARPAAPCKACNGVGLCNLMPEDDSACGTIDCDVLNTTCLEYEDLTTKRCGVARRLQGAEHGGELHGLHEHLYAPAAAGTGTGGRGGSGGGRRRQQRQRPAARRQRARRHDRTAATRRGRRRDRAPTAADGGSAGGGGGGCCSVGGADTPTGVVGLLVFASVLLTRRRRR